MMADDDTGAPEVESAESETSLIEDLRSEFSGAEQEGTFDEDVSPSAEAEEPSTKDSAERETTVSEEASVSGDEDSIPVEETAEIIQPPEHWSAEHKSAFDKLDAPGREFFMDRHRSMEGELTRRSQELAGIKKAFEPHKEEMDLNGLSMEQAVTRILAAHRLLQTDPARGISHLAEEFGVTLTSPAAESVDEFSDDEDFSETDPRVEKRIAELEKKLDYSRQENAQQRQADQANATAQYLVQFGKETDESGNLLRPYFDNQDVQRAMARVAGSLLEEGKKYTYDDLYDQAVWMVPGIREKVFSGKTVANESDEARRDKVIRAKRASAGARGISKSPISRASEDVPEDLGEHLKREFAAAAEGNK